MKDYQRINKSVFNNGLTLISEKLDNFFTVAVGFWIKSGTQDEHIDINGMAHLIEHMNFKGTDKRTSEEISSFIESKGGQINAYTSKEVTCYYARVLPEYLDEAIELLSDIVFHSTFPPSELEKEKKVIYDEIRDVEDNPSEWAADLFYEELFKGCSFSYPILGSEESVEKISRKQINEFLETHYRPGNTLVSVAGPIDHEKIKKRVEALVTRDDSVNETKIVTPYDIQSYRGNCRLMNKEISQVHSVIGLPMPDTTHGDKWPLVIFNTFLGAGMSSLLFQEIREKMGIAYAIYSFLDFYRTSGVWGIYWASEEKNYLPVIEEIQTIFSDKIKKKFDEEQLTSAKNQIKGGLYMSMESVVSRMNRLSKNEMYYKRVMPIDEIVDEINKVTLGDIDRVLNLYFYKKTMTVAVVGDMPVSRARPVEL